MNTIQAFLKEYDHIPPEEKCMALALTEERFLKLKQILEEGINQPEIVQELMLKLLNDLEIIKGIQLKKEEQAAKICTPFYLIFDDDDDEEYTIQVREYIKNSTVAITPDFPITDSLIMEDEHIDTIPETESDEENKSSVATHNVRISVLLTLFSDELEYDLPPCDDFSPIDIPEGKFVTFSNPLFDSNDDFTSSDDESLSDEDVLEDNVKVYSNALFEFNDEYIFGDVNPLFDEVLEDIEIKDSCGSNLDEPALLVTPLSYTYEDECFDPGGNIF
ncbi:hypothetical protein Tco_0156323 [Tanacetum coccineum]